MENTTPNTPDNPTDTTVKPEISLPGKDATSVVQQITDIMKQNAAKAVNEAIKAKQSYKSLKMSLKKEQEVSNKKKTLTDKPITKIEVNPKIEG